MADRRCVEWLERGLQLRLQTVPNRHLEGWVVAEPDV